MIAARSAKNTAWCLLGCAVGDLGTIHIFERAYAPGFIPESRWLLVWGLAMLMGILTSIALETLILWRQLGPKNAFRTAVGMSLLSMILMEFAMNLADFGMMGAPSITLGVLPYTLGAGFVAAWPYNYWRLKKFGKCCHG
jgi:predicted membrane channel-forming protein YqfA (hemolysin III family)